LRDGHLDDPGEVSSDLGVLSAISNRRQYLPDLHRLDGDNFGRTRHWSFADAKHGGSRARFVFGLEDHHCNATSTLRGKPVPALGAVFSGSRHSLLWQKHTSGIRVRILRIDLGENGVHQGTSCSVIFSHHRT